MAHLRSLFPALLLASATAAASQAVSGCQWLPVAIDPAAGDDARRYVGRSTNVEVEFVSERREGPVEAFPDSPLLVRQIAAGTQCAIDGGVWARGGVFVSRSGSVLAAQEFSGSNDALKFYDAASCKLLDTIDISDSEWALRGADLVVSKAKTPSRRAGTRTTYRFDAACLRKRPAR